MSMIIIWSADNIMLFCSICFQKKTLSPNELYKMISEAKNKNVCTLLSELNQHVGNRFKNVDYYLRTIEKKIIPIEQLSF